MTALIAHPGSDRSDSSDRDRSAQVDTASSTGGGQPDGSTPPYGALSRAEATRLFGSVGLREVLATGEWVELWAGVVVPGRWVHEPLTRASAALVRAGPYSVLSGQTAVAMHGCPAAAGPVIDVTTPYDRQSRSRPGLAVHQARIREWEVVELDGLRVHALDVALAELLCTGPQRMALTCLEQALAAFGTDGAEHLRALIVERVRRRADRRGTRRAAAVLELARDPRAAHGRAVAVAGKAFEQRELRGAQRSSNGEA